ncbi:MAG: type VI secretion system Vgr family protein [Sandaracinaceae bacterium]
MPPFDEEIDDVEKVVDDAGAGARDVGRGKQDLDKAGQDVEDGDQDTADKGSNAGHESADALRDGDQALKDWGILDPNDSSLSDLANDLDGLTETVFGKKPPPSRLPPVRYRLFFGKQDLLQSLEQNMLDDAMGIGDSLLEAGATAIGADDYLGTDPVSSIMAKHSPFAEDVAMLDAAESQWTIMQVRCDEGLNVVWRCEMVIVAPEQTNARLEDVLDDMPAGGGLISDVAGPIRSAIDTVDELKRIADGDDVDAESPLGKTVNGFKDRINGISGGIDRLSNAKNAEDAFGAISDMVFGGGDGGPSTEDKVFANIAIDPSVFLGQTCSIRVSREFAANAVFAAGSSDAAGYTYSARYLTGVVVEMEDLGVRRPKSVAGFNGVSQRYVRIVVRPELAKLALRKNHRVFNEMRALAIVREVFRSAGVYGFLPDIPGVGLATNAIAQGVSNLPVLGNAMGDALSGQYIKLIPPPYQNPDVAKAGAAMPAEDWTQKREMCVQYGETDLDFVRRLLEEEGIHFTFTCRRGFERIVLVHDPRLLDEAPTVDGRPIPYRWPAWMPNATVETLIDGAEWRKVRSTKVTLRDFSYSDPMQAATELVAPAPGASAPLSVTSEASVAFGERYEYPGQYPFQYEKEGDPPIDYRLYGSDKLDRPFAQLRLEEEASRARRVTLHTDLIGAACDANVRVRGYPFQRDGATAIPTAGPPPADRLVVERVRWEGTPNPSPTVRVGTFVPPTGPAVMYRNEITGWWTDATFPAQTPIRPARTMKKPRVASLTTATVVDWTGDHDEDEEIEHEHPTSVRVRVRFHWDRRGELPLGILPPIGYIAQRGASCWCRVAQGWAGADFGVMFVPRVGSEVVVAFENGDPDRPVIVGSLYDGLHPVPVPGREAPREGFKPPAAEHNQLSTISTHTSPWDEDDGVRSELTFDDTSGKERVFLKAGRHLIEEVYGEHRTRVGDPDADGVGIQTNEVGRHHSEIVEQRQRLRVGGDRDKTVFRGQLETIEGSREVRVLGDQTVLVTSDHTETVEGVVSMTIKGDRTLTIHGTRDTVVGDPDDPTPAHDIHDVTGNKTDTIVGTLKVRAKALAIGEPGEADDAPLSSLAVGPNADGEPELKATSDVAYKLTAAKEVRIESKSAGVELVAKEGLSAMVEASMLDMTQRAGGGVTVWHPTRVEVHTQHDLMVAHEGELRLRAMDEADALAILGPGGVRIDGRTGVVKATKEIRGKSGMQTGGGG